MDKSSNKAVATAPTKKAIKARKSKAVATTDPLLRHGFEVAGKKHTALSVAKEAVAVDKQSVKLEGSKASFGANFILLARTCKGVQDFLDTMGTIEARMSWTSAQNKAGNSKAPQVWTQTKSNVKVMWDKYHKGPKTYNTTAELNENLQAAREAEKKASSTAEASQTATQAIERAAGTDQSFANLLDKLTTLYGEQSEDGKKDLFNDLAEVYNLYNDTDQETKELLADLDHVEIEEQTPAQIQ